MEKIKSPIVFFARCKPQGEDIINLVVNNKFVPIGYPPLKEGGNIDDDLKSWIKDVRDFQNNNEFLNDLKEEAKRWGGQYMKNKNIIDEAVPGSLIIVPRPKKGECCIGKVKVYHFDKEKFNEAKKKYPKNNGIWRDTVQYWEIEGGFKHIPFFMIPGWIRKSLFGRSTFGKVCEKNPKGKKNKDAYTFIKKLYDSNGENKDRFQQKDNIREALYNFLTPTVFEHFICNILHLKDETNGYHWWNTGGSGDGGIDCLGFDECGKMIGVAQCKLSGTEDLKKLGENMKKEINNEKVKIYVADFYNTRKYDTEADKKIEIWTQDKIIEEFEKIKDKSNYTSMMGLK